MFARVSFASCPTSFIFLLAIISNLILAIIQPRIDWRDQAEPTRIAVSIAGNQGFSSPFRSVDKSPVYTGPSAWIPPVYPYLLAGIFRVFGVFTVTSAWVAVAVNIIVHAFTCVVLYWAARETFGLRSGVYAAIALATFPLLFYPLVLLHILGNVYIGWGLFIPPTLLWYTHLSELAIMLLIWLTLRQPNWAVYGMTWGIGALINPGLLSLLPAFLAYRLWHRDHWYHLGLAAATAAVCVAPWLARNCLVFGHPVFIRDNFGVELRAGNQPGGMGLWNPNVIPDHNAYELTRVVKMGEPSYAQVAGQEAMDSIRSRPGEFAQNTVLRIAYFWIGTPPPSHLLPQRLQALRFLKLLPLTTLSFLAFYGAGRALRRGNGKALLFAAVLFFYPLVYYITHVVWGFQYQYAIEPVMLGLATSVFIREDTTKVLEPNAPTRAE